MDILCFVTAALPKYIRILTLFPITLKQIFLLVLEIYSVYVGGLTPTVYDTEVEMSKSPWHVREAASLRSSGITHHTRSSHLVLLDHV